jgi:hypothetical protein
VGRAHGRCERAFPRSATTPGVSPRSRRIRLVPLHTDRVLIPVSEVTDRCVVVARSLGFGSLRSAQFPLRRVRHEETRRRARKRSDTNTRPQPDNDPDDTHMCECTRHTPHARLSSYVTFPRRVDVHDEVRSNCERIESRFHCAQPTPLAEFHISTHDNNATTTRCITNCCSTQHCTTIRHVDGARKSVAATTVNSKRL